MGQINKRIYRPYPGKTKYLCIILIIRIITLFIFVFGFQAANAQPLAEIRFEQMDHDFGQIKETDGLATYNFKFANTGKIPLIVQSVDASCGCTMPEWSHDPILPGKTGFIKVSYNPEFRPGIFTKTISVNANIPKSIVLLTISGEVIPKDLMTEDVYPVDFGNIRLESNELSFVKVKDNELKTDTLRFYSSGATPVTVGYKYVPPYITIKTVPAVIPPKTKGTFIISFNGPKKPSYGYVSNSIYLSFNGEDRFDNAIKVSATVEEDFSKLSETALANAPKIDFNSRTFDFGEIKEGIKPEFVFKIMNKGKRDLIIRNVSVTCGCLSARPVLTTIPPGGNTEMKATFDSGGKEGMQNKIITVISNDPGHATTVLRVAGTVKK